MNKSESVKELAGALAKAQAEMKNPAYDAKNPHFKSQYASLAAVREVVLPVLSKYGLAVVQLLGNAEGDITCETILLHESGEWLSGTLAIKPTKADAHGAGSAATYCRRYSLMAIVGVVGDEDDDGNAAVQTKTAEKPPKASPEARNPKTYAEYAAELDKLPGADSVLKWKEENGAAVKRELSAAEVQKLSRYASQIIDLFNSK
jgi:hypothetical protein